MNLSPVHAGLLRDVFRRPEGLVVASIYAPARALWAKGLVRRASEGVGYVRLRVTEAGRAWIRDHPEPPRPRFLTPSSWPKE